MTVIVRAIRSTPQVAIGATPTDDVNFNIPFGARVKNARVRCANSNTPPILANMWLRFELGNTQVDIGLGLGWISKGSLFGIGNVEWQGDMPVSTEYPCNLHVSFYNPSGEVINVIIEHTYEVVK